MREVCDQSCKSRSPLQKHESHVSQRESPISGPKCKAHAKHSKACVSHTKAQNCVKLKVCVMVWRSKLIQARTQQLKSSSPVHVKPELRALNRQCLKDSHLVSTTVLRKCTPQCCWERLIIAILFTYLYGSHVCNQEVCKWSSLASTSKSCRRHHYHSKSASYDMENPNHS